MTSDQPTALLILSNRDDLSADFLITHLLERGLPYYRLNADELSATHITAHIAAGKNRVQLEVGGSHLDLSDVGAVWYRRALRPTIADQDDPGVRRFKSDELRQLYEGLVAGLPAVWVNGMSATERAEHKVLQLQLAASCGLLAPPTLVSTDPTAIDEFARSEGKLICKPVSQGLVELDGRWHAAHTRVVTDEERTSPERLASFPTLLQRLVPKGVDVRVTVIGKAVFAVEIRTPIPAVDWRALGPHADYRACTLPERVARACRAMMRSLDLRFGAFDFIRTDEDEWFFLEVNPAGEWAWLEVALGLPMREAFVCLFYGG